MGEGPPEQDDANVDTAFAVASSANETFSAGVEGLGFEEFTQILHLKYQVLVGVNILKKGQFLVDPSKKTK